MSDRQSYLLKSIVLKSGCLDGHNRSFLCWLIFYIPCKYFSSNRNYIRFIIDRRWIQAPRIYLDPVVVSMLLSIRRVNWGQKGKSRAISKGVGQELSFHRLVLKTPCNRWSVMDTTRVYQVRRLENPFRNP